MDDEFSRKCSRCGKKKLLSEYFKNPNCTGGYTTFCKKCRPKSNTRARFGKKYDNAYRKRFPERIRAGELVLYKISIGAIKRGCCAICSKKKAEAHHSDYSRPFLISWLCRRHHLAVHRIFKGELAIKAKDYSEASL